MVGFGKVGEVTLSGVVSGNVVQASGSVNAVGNIGSVSISATSAARFDSTSVTLDSTAKTFDEG